MSAHLKCWKVRAWPYRIGCWLKTAIPNLPGEHAEAEGVVSVARRERRAHDAAVVVQVEPRGDAGVRGRDEDVVVA